MLNQQFRQLRNVGPRSGALRQTSSSAWRDGGTPSHFRQVNSPLSGAMMFVSPRTSLYSAVPQVGQRTESSRLLARLLRNGRQLIARALPLLAGCRSLTGAILFRSLMALNTKTELTKRVAHNPRACSPNAASALLGPYSLAPEILWISEHGRKPS